MLLKWVEVPLAQHAARDELSARRRITQLEPPLLMAVPLLDPALVVALPLLLPLLLALDALLKPLKQHLALGTLGLLIGGKRVAHAAQLLWRERSDGVG